MIFSLLLLAATGAAFPDCHTSGMAKTTYATSPESARAGANLLMRALNLSASRDSWPGAVAVCPAGTSGAEDEWAITMGRVETLADPATAGACYVRTAAGDGVAAALENATRVLPYAWGSGKGCRYGGGAATATTYAYVVPAHTEETCCNACALDEACEEAWYAPGPEEQTEKNFAGECFGLHITAVVEHADGPGMKLEDVEAEFDKKCGKMRAFDWFMDYNAAFFTRGLDAYLARFDALGLAWLPATWTHADETFYSVFLHVPRTQLVVELVAFDSARLASMARDRVMYKDGATYGFRPALAALEARMSPARIAQFLTTEADDARLLISSVGRATSDLAAVEAFYVDGFGATKTQDVTEDGVARKCFQAPETTADVCFTTRPDAATAGDFAPRDFEGMLRRTHEYWLKGSPLCNMDRWMDNHVAFDAQVRGGYDRLMNWTVARPDVRYTCPDAHRPRHHHPGPKRPRGGAHYVVDPTGWGIQVDGPQTVVLPGCDATTPAAAGGINACDGGPPNGTDCLYWCDAGTCAH